MTNRSLARVLPLFLLVTVARAQAASWQSRLEQPTLSASDPAAMAILATAQPPVHDPLAFARRADDLVAHTPVVEWVVEARADALEGGVEPAFRYVRDAIGYEVYPGVLRGAAGTYAARAGNAADRALLLAALLERKHVPVRFAFGTLAAADRERLLQRVFDAPVLPAQEAGGVGATPDGRSFRERIAARATRDYGVVRRALGDRLPPVTSPARADLLAEMEPHVWVQAQVDGSWIDLDPSFADGKPGVTAAAADRTAARLPAELFQRVTIRVLLEQLREGKLTQVPMLELTRNAVDVVDRQLFVLHTPAHQGLAGIGAALGGRDAEWTPAVWLGGEFIMGKSFTVDEASATRQPGRGLQGALDALAAEPEAPAPNGPEFVAEWLEFELSGPGMHEVTRRVLAERGGAAWRAKASHDPKALQPLLRDADGPLVMRAMHNVWLSAGPHDLSAYADAMQDLAIENLSLAAGDAPRNADDFGASVWPLALQNFAWMVWTDHAAIPALNRTPGVRLYADRPRIAIFTIAPTANDGAVVMSDLRRDDLRGVASTPAGAALLAERKLWFGVLQGSLEHEGIGQVLASLGADPATVVTTSSHLQADGVAVLQPGNALPGAPHRVDPESAARLAVAFDAHSVVVAPWSGLGAAGSWWEITAGSGDVRSVGELGLHSGGGPLPNKHNPFFRGKSPQQNPYGGQKPAYTPEAAKEARDAARRAANNKKAADYAKNYRNQQANLARSAPAGGSEYTTLTKVIMVVGAIAHAILGYYIASSFMNAVDALGPE